MDRDATFKLQRELGIDSNPWASFPRIITSMDYLRQGDILASFNGATERISGRFDALLPWQMLVVDEVHNLAPASYGDNSDRCEMLRSIVPFFEHRLFLSATPHNGYTFSFTGLLELLDPVRFQQKGHLDEQDLHQLEATMVRRLKKELNIAGMPDRFAPRTVDKLDIALYPQEKALFEALREYRTALQQVLGAKSKRERHLGDFLVKLLTKRLLSSSYAFARTWWRHVAGIEGHDEVQDVAVTSHAVERAEAVMNDDQERGLREEDATQHTGSWLHDYADELKVEREYVSLCLERLGWGRQLIEQVAEHPQSLASLTFPVDSRWERLLLWIDQRLRLGKKFRDDERLIIFTEYKHTLDYLMERLYHEGFTHDQVRSLFGGASSQQREAIKTAFNDARNPLRILVGTDTVSEGISLQMTCRYVIHQEIPWNPMRLEQRNGRVDRHGQERDVEIFHFSSDDEADLRFMQVVVRKVEQARADLGSVGQVIDHTIEEYFTQGLANPEQVLDQRVAEVQDDAQDVKDMQRRDRGDLEKYTQALHQLQETETTLELTPEHCAELLMMAVDHEKGRLEEEETSDGPVYRFALVPTSWKKLVKETLERQSGNAYALPKLVFNPEYFEHGSRHIFKPRTDAVLIRLGHPLMQRALGVLRRRLWDNKGLFRWTVQGCSLPRGMHSILVLNLFLEVTNQFREVAHQEVITIPFDVKGNRLTDLPQRLWDTVKVYPRYTFEGDEFARQTDHVREFWLHHQDQIRNHIFVLRGQVQQDFEQRMQLRYDEEYVREQAVFAARLQELDRQREPKQLEALRQESEREQKKLRKIMQERLQPTLLPEFDIERLQKQTQSMQRIRELDFDMERAVEHIARMKDVVERERARVLEHVLPKRYALAAVDLQPLTIEYIVNSTGKERS